MTLVLASLVSTGGAGKDNWPGDPWLGPGDPWLGLPSCWPGDPWPGRFSGAGGPGCPSEGMSQRAGATPRRGLELDFEKS